MMLGIPDNRSASSLSRATYSWVCSAYSTSRPASGVSPCPEKAPVASSTRSALIGPTSVPTSTQWPETVTDPTRASTTVALAPTAASTSARTWARGST